MRAHAAIGFSAFLGHSNSLVESTKADMAKSDFDAGFQ